MWINNYSSYVKFLGWHFIAFHPIFWFLIFPVPLPLCFLNFRWYNRFTQEWAHIGHLFPASWLGSHLSSQKKKMEKMIMNLHKLPWRSNRDPMYPLRLDNQKTEWDYYWITFGVWLLLLLLLLFWDRLALCTSGKSAHLLKLIREVRS